MATRSYIAVEIETDKVISVYCHHDGYLSGVGKSLMQKFPDGTDSDKVVDFISEGDRTSADMSYMEMRNEECPPGNHKGVSDFFQWADEHAYLYTSEGQWLHQSPNNRGAVQLLDLSLKSIVEL